MENKEKIVRKIANRVSDKYKLYPPVDFKEILLQKGIRYREEKLVTNGDGYSDLRESDMEIVVNSDMNYLPRKRFTIAHELGHIFIGWHDDVTLCRTDNEYAAHNMLDIQEKEANVFASELLMPTEWVKNQLSRYADYGLDYVIRRLCDEAETSLMACFYALENAMQSGNVLLVFTPSVDFAKRFVSNNTEICYLRNMDFQECCETICTGRRGYAGRGGKNPGKAPACLQRFPSLSPAALLVFFPASAWAGIVWIYLFASGNHFPGDSIGHDHCRNFVSVGIQVKAEAHRSQLIR